MKTIEEKAKAYDKAIKVAKEWHTDAQIGFKANLEKLFPELAESDDERISRELIAYFKNNSVYVKWSRLDVKKVIEWLEKQKYTQKDVDDAYLKGICDAKQEFEKQGEKKTTDKIEPKFKLGDWVIDTVTDSVNQIIKISSSEYICSGHLIISFDNQHLLKKWTIGDAKDGDVVVFNNKVYLLKGITIDDTDDIIGFSYYCVYYDDKLESGYFLQPIDIEKVTPASNDQRNLLLSKMKEEGYKLNTAEKKLEKIESQPTEWSEEDEKMYRMCVDAVEYYHTPEDESVVRDWLKSLKDKI